ncbi:MAG: low molecular weight phosphotyrosine protein phosphatase [Rhodobacteraceae bacterium]|nr:low molecular weight phosphotyrosine protein phosphatase [Paracoccaceae bacterium]
MIKSVLVVCTANICRSPVAARILKGCCPDLRVESAGLHALEGHPASEDMTTIAAETGLSMEGHAARQFTIGLASKYDLILVMEPEQRAAIMHRAPQISGKVMLFDHWTGCRGIPDPYTGSLEFNRHVFTKIQEAAKAWAGNISGQN